MRIFSPPERDSGFGCVDLPCMAGKVHSSPSPIFCGWWANGHPEDATRCIAGRHILAIPWSVSCRTASSLSDEADPFLMPRGVNVGSDFVKGLGVRIDTRKSDSARLSRTTLGCCLPTRTANRMLCLVLPIENLAGSKVR